MTAGALAIRLPRGTAPPVAAATLSLAELSALAPAWDRLVEAAAYPNPFYSRAVIEAHAAHGIPVASRFCAVTRGGELAALVPLVRRRIGLWQTGAAGWASPFTTNGTPLLAGDDPESAAGALLDAVAGQGPLVMLRLVALDDPVLGVLRRALADRAWPHVEIGPFDRPVLDRRDSFVAYSGEHLSGTRRKGLRRRRARLAELGDLTFRTATEGEPLSRAVDQFLALENAGWKGARGTALASRPDTMRFARALFAERAGPVTPRADMLCLDGRAIAVSLALVCGGKAHLLKTAFDETLRPYAPGVVLEAEIVRACHDERFVERLDSASFPGGIFDGLYADRERIGDLLFATSAAANGSALARRADEERLRRRIMKRATQLYWRVKGFG
jgi:CelD/BcsL family acetyltransferase involved in cellulose biosynthesis